jgi:hypothetical protein
LFPLRSMWGHTNARLLPAELQESRIARIPDSMFSRSPAFCSRSPRTWTHGARPEPEHHDVLDLGQGLA